MFTDKVPDSEARTYDPTEKEVLSLLDGLIADVIHKERQSNEIQKSTAITFDDPSAVAVAYSYEEMIRIVEEFRKRPGNIFHKLSNGLGSPNAIDHGLVTSSTYNSNFS